MGALIRSRWGNKDTQTLALNENDLYLHDTAVFIFTNDDCIL